MTANADWWSYGVLLFEALAGRPPYPNDQNLLHAHARLVHEIIHGERAPLPDQTDSSRSDAVSQAARALLDGLLERDEYSRLTRPAELRTHPFFSGTRWAALLAKHVPSPLLALPSPQPARRGARRAAPRAVDGIDVFAYPSVLAHAAQPAARPPAAAMAAADAADATDAAGAAASTGGENATSAFDPLLGMSAPAEPRGLDGWEYVRDEGPGSRGARLWRRVRARIDLMARLNNLSRHSFLICVALTLAAKDATGGSIESSVLADVEAAGAPLAASAEVMRDKRPTHQRSKSVPAGVAW